MEVLPASRPSALHASPRSADSISPIDSPRERPFIPRRAHTKSRGGCISCKRRRQKCDEEKPACARCQRLGFDCAYAEPKSCDMSLESSVISSLSKSGAWSPDSDEGDFMRSLTCLTLSNAATVSATIQAMLQLSSNRLTASAADDISFFVHTEHSNSFGNPEIQLRYRIGAVRMGMTRPYLMHSLLALATMQKRITQSTYSAPSAHETTHWHRATQLFRARLAEKAPTGDSEALLATSAFMNGLSFASMSSLDPEEAWPISDPPDALSWLGMLRGPALMLAELRQEVGPTKFKESPAALANDLINDPDIFREGIEGIPRAWVKLCDFTPASNQHNNPYHTTVRAVCYWMHSTRPESGAYFAFVGGVHQRYTALLRAKDHRAMLVLSYWYALLCTSEFWWCRTRAFVECKSICIYLERHGSNEVIDMLEVPAAACGHQLLRTMSFDNGPLAMAVPNNCSMM